MSKKKKVKPVKKMFCDRCNMVTPHLLLKHLKTTSIEKGRVIQCKQCKEKTVIDVNEL